jgi:hypothetical protein
MGTSSCKTRAEISIYVSKIWHKHEVFIKLVTTL